MAPGRHRDDRTCAGPARPRGPVLEVPSSRSRPRGPVLEVPSSRSRPRGPVLEGEPRPDGPGARTFPAPPGTPRRRLPRPDAAWPADPTATAAPETPRTSRRSRRTLWYWAKAIAAILILRAFIGEPYRIPSESMEDTLLVGDFLIVSKMHWGPRTPATIGRAVYARSTCRASNSPR